MATAYSTTPLPLQKNWIAMGTDRKECLMCCWEVCSRMWKYRLMRRMSGCVCIPDRQPVLAEAWMHDGVQLIWQVQSKGRGKEVVRDGRHRLPTEMGSLEASLLHHSGRWLFSPISGLSPLLISAVPSTLLWSCPATLAYLLVMATPFPLENHPFPSFIGGSFVSQD